MKYGFIGCGNMGSAIARALSKSTLDMMLCDPSEKAAALAAELGCVSGKNEEAAECCQRIFLAVKPQVLRQVLTPLAPILQRKKPVLITMAAGVTVHSVENMAGTPLPIIRIMPNTPVAVGKGTIVYCCNELVTDQIRTDFLADMCNCGYFDRISEDIIDPVCALSGCGPAYAYMFLEALCDGAAACGVPKEKALEYAANTLLGAAEMVLQTGTDPLTLRDAVCSPGGSTVAGVKVLENNHFHDTVAACIHAAYHRTLELGK